jgi:hypothetical protein
VRPRRLAGLGARPLNFTVRALMFWPRMVLAALAPAAIWAAFVALYLLQRPLGLLYAGLALAGFSLTVPAVVLLLRSKSNDEARLGDLGYVAWLRRGFLSGLLAMIVYFLVMFVLAFAGMGPRSALDALLIWLAFASFVRYSSAKRLR